MYNILVVDDEARIRSIIKKYAEFEGHTVTEAGDGMEAVRLTRLEKFDIVIMDIMMPELDGFSACREIRKTSNTPIIMLSARGEEYDRINGFELGIDDYVVKPFSPKELMLRMNAIMKRVSRGAEVATPKKQNTVYNLVNNAINYTGESKKVVVSQTVDADRVKISVSDRGPGIAPEDLPYIWDRYYKVDKIHKRAQIGTGLGLSIVKGILEAHSTSYGVESKMGEGSVFWFDMEAIDNNN